MITSEQMLDFEDKNDVLIQQLRQEIADSAASTIPLRHPGGQIGQQPAESEPSHHAEENPDGEIALEEIEPLGSVSCAHEG